MPKAKNTSSAANNGARVYDALLALAEAGHFPPSLEKLAAKTKLSLEELSYFGTRDLDWLLFLCRAADLEAAQGEAVPRGTPWEEHLFELMMRKVELWQKHAGGWRTVWKKTLPKIHLAVPAALYLLPTLECTAESLWPHIHGGKRVALTLMLAPLFCKTARAFANNNGRDINKIMASLDESIQTFRTWAERLRLV